MWRVRWVTSTGTTFTGAPIRAYTSTSPTPDY